MNTWSGLLGALVAGEDLAGEDTEWAMDQVMTGSATAAQIAGFAIALRAKGETAAEIGGMASAMLEHAKRFRTDRTCLDIVGTGGDQAGTVNISTMAALVAAAAGSPVVKHGGRAASSKSGTADVLEALGVVIELPADAVRRCVAEVGIGFCFAPAFHPALRHAIGPRRELGVPTAFNVLGPLTNPAQPGAGLFGCANERFAPVMAEVFATRGTRALVVRGDDGLDELTTTATSTVRIVADGGIRTVGFDPVRIGVPRVDVSALHGGDANHNARVVRELLDGRKGPVRDAVLLNAAGAIAVHTDPLDGELEELIESRMATAAEAVDSGAAHRLLEQWASLTKRLAD
ncbi:anthranilate phosphoribosyltransferase [Sciscionella sediminilitoris]|uniref:anthranilate phosphoribosyltransferase n=1 Tax=Sciscionella sediminilitoris TaxID=1445613 RepID=UPI0004DF7FDF|nr:anthranilate phosphoribosyltransferase [Sciscionella sp. SE31]